MNLGVFKTLFLLQMPSQCGGQNKRVQCLPQVTPDANRQLNRVALAIDTRRISAMELDDQRHYDAAQGWLELGNLPEAEAALDRISPGIREQPAVLEMRFHICAQREG